MLASWLWEWASYTIFSRVVVDTFTMMNYKMMYQAKPKKKRPVDPNQPPRPNLLSHEKVIKGISLTLESAQAIITRQQAEIDLLKRKLVTVTYRLDLLTDLTRELRNKIR
jgi:hypothetical protein